jgi:Mce-associated membrane protein
VTTPEDERLTENKEIQMKLRTRPKKAGSQPSVNPLDREETEQAGDDEQSEPDPATIDATRSGESSEAERETNRRPALIHVLAYGLLPGFALLLALGAGFLKWHDSAVRDSELAGIESVQAAKDSTAALLSYGPKSVDKDLTAARDRLTGNFRDSYTSLINDVVIPGAKQKQISAIATIPAAASVSADEGHAVVLVFVNQRTIVGNGAPTDSASTVRATLEKIDGRWLISDFEPI